MQANEYQHECSRTFPDLDMALEHMRKQFDIEITGNGAYRFVMLFHSMMGLCSEVGEMAAILQKVIQGHEFDERHMASEMGDARWFMAECATGLGYNLGEIDSQNIAKLKLRYKGEHFTVDESLHRDEGDI